MVLRHCVYARPHLSIVSRSSRKLYDQSPSLHAATRSASRQIPPRSVFIRLLPHVRCASSHARRHFEAVIVGAGPAGLTCAANLLDLGLSSICLVDPFFQAGRINALYREVPSNTKAGTFAQWATGTQTGARILQGGTSGSGGNQSSPFANLTSIDPENTCQLSTAVDVAQQLSDGLRDDPRVASYVGKVSRLQRQDGVWVLPDQDATAERVVLATGSHPRPTSIGSSHRHLSVLPLDIALSPTRLRAAVSPGSTVGVVGSSHSAILVLKNLYEMGGVSVVNFYRSPLLYAVFKDGWILYDNTGLKGIAADWAKEVLDSGRVPASIRRVNLREDERSEAQIYQDELPACSHLVGAVGYERNELPVVEIEEALVEPVFDQLTGGFSAGTGGAKTIQGLHGVGIAFPERVTDPVGNVESAVGWLKFLKFIQRVSPQWLGRAV